MSRNNGILEIGIAQPLHSYTATVLFHQPHLTDGGDA